MRIVFIGQAPFGKDCLNELIGNNETVVGVITVADKKDQKKIKPKGARKMIQDSNCIETPF